MHAARRDQHLEGLAVAEGAEILVDQLQPGQSILRAVDSALDYDLIVRGSTARPLPR